MPETLPSHPGWRSMAEEDVFESTSAAPRSLGSEKFVGRENAVDSLDLTHRDFLGPRRIELLKNEEAGCAPSQALDEGSSGAMLAIAQLHHHVIANAGRTARMHIDKVSRLITGRHAVVDHVDGVNIACRRDSGGAPNEVDLGAAQFELSIVSSGRRSQYPDIAWQLGHGGKSSRAPW